MISRTLDILIDIARGLVFGVALLIFMVPVVQEELLRDARDCTAVPLTESVTDGQVTVMLQQGWVSRPGDGVEALYPPGC